MKKFRDLQVGDHLHIITNCGYLYVTMPITEINTYSGSMYGDDITAIYDNGYADGYTAGFNDGVSVDTTVSIAQVDDLDNIDDLISDFIEFDLDEDLI